MWSAWSGSPAWLTRPRRACPTWDTTSRLSWVTEAWGCPIGRPSTPSLWAPRRPGSRSPWHASSVRAAAWWCQSPADRSARSSPACACATAAGSPSRWDPAGSSHSSERTPTRRAESPRAPRRAAEHPHACTAGLPLHSFIGGIAERGAEEDAYLGLRRRLVHRRPGYGDGVLVDTVGSIGVAGTRHADTQAELENVDLVPAGRAIENGSVEVLVGPGAQLAQLRGQVLGSRRLRHPDEPSRHPAIRLGCSVSAVSLAAARRPAVPQLIEFEGNQQHG